jgi:hypothetical protein
MSRLSMLKRRMLRRIASLLLFGCACLAPQIALACPGCKDSLNANYAAAYGASIIFMLSMPFLILGGLSAYFYWEVRRARKKQATMTDAASTVGCVKSAPTHQPESVQC